MRILFLSILLIGLTYCTFKAPDVKVRFNENGLDEINTFDNTWTRQYLGGSETVTFHLTPEERHKINEYADSIQLENIVSPGDTCVNHPPESFTISLPGDQYELEFEITGKGTKALVWGNNICRYPQILKLQGFVDSLGNMIRRKKEIQNLRETDIIRL